MYALLSPRGTLTRVTDAPEPQSAHAAIVAEIIEPATCGR